MAAAGELSERKKQILKAIVDAHIQMGEPVGSKYLTQSQQFSCSSATIRNEMAELEGLGYLEQPHTSAGRVPTEAGYRFYVDTLIERYRFNAAEIERLRQTIRARQAEMKSIIETGAKLASSMTNYTALAVQSKTVNVTASRFEIMRLDAHNLVLVVMTSDGSVKTRHLKMPFETSADGVAVLSEIMNNNLTGLGADDISLPIMMEIEKRMGPNDYIVSPIIKAVCEELTSFEGGQLSVEGLSRLLAYPEYADAGRAKALLAMLEEKDDVVRLIDSAGAADGDLHVFIGSENTVKIMEGSTLVLKALKGSGGTMGAIGIIGPVRMDYTKVISVLDNLTSQIVDMAGTESFLLPEGDAAEE